MTKTDQPRIPNIGEYVRGLGTLVALEQPVPQPLPPIEYVFVQQTAYYEVRLRGDKLRQSSTRWDYAGLGWAAKYTLADARQFAEDNQIEPDSILEVVVIQETTKVRMQPQDRPCHYDASFRDFEPSREPRFGLGPPEKEIVWSSKNPGNAI